MKINFVLIADGLNVLRSDDIIIHETTPEKAVEVAKTTAAALSKAGYRRFALFDVREEIHRKIANIKVEHPAPIVIVS